MKAFVIYPGHGVATIDIARGLGHGLEANGCRVEAYPLEGRAVWFESLLRKDGRVKEAARTDAAYIMAGEEIASRILRFEPDLVLIVHGGLLGKKFWDALQPLRRLFPVHLVLTECPYEDDYFEAYLKLADQVWANDRLSAERWGVHYLPPAYDPIVHHPPAESIGGCPDALFVGTGWKERIDFFSEIDWRGLSFRIVGPIDTWQAAEGTPVWQYIEHAGIPNDSIFAYYAGSGASLNLHRRSRDLNNPRDSGAAWSLNPRCYEVPACGGLLLSDHRPEWDFVFGKTLPTFSEPKELEALLRHYLKNPGARQDAIFASMESVRPHTYQARAARLLEEV